MESGSKGHLRMGQRKFITAPDFNRGSHAALSASEESLRDSDLDCP